MIFIHIDHILITDESTLLGIYRTNETSLTPLLENK